MTYHPPDCILWQTGGFDTMKRNASARRSSRARRAVKKKRRKVKAIFMTVTVLTLAICIFVFMENTMKTTLSTTAEMKSREMVEHIVNDAVYELTHDKDGTELEIIHTAQDAGGDIELVTLNTSLLNKIGTEIAKRVNNDIYYNDTKQIRLSLGSILGSRLLSQTGPYFTFDLVPVAVINIGYNTEFESAGINQSKYKVYLHVNSETRLLAPFMSEKIRTENTILIAEAVIVGDVPETYTNIPKEDISELIPG